jgi:chorismate mutase
VTDGIGGSTPTSAADRAAAVEELARRRRELEELDRELIALLGRRVARSREIGALKRVAGLPTLDPAREAEVIRRAAAMAREAGLPDEKVRDIFWHVIGLSREAQVEND